MANSEKDKPKRTCIDCHFFMVIPQLDCGVPPIIGEDEDYNPVYCDMKTEQLILIPEILCLIILAMHVYILYTISVVVSMSFGFKPIKMIMENYMM